MIIFLFFASSLLVCFSSFFFPENGKEKPWISFNVVYNNMVSSNHMHWKWRVYHVFCVH